MPSDQKEPELAGPTKHTVDPTSSGARGEFLSGDPLATSSKFPEKPLSNEWLEPWEDSRVYGICDQIPNKKT